MSNGLNTGNSHGKSIYDSSGNSNKGILIGDYKVKKVRKGEPMRETFIKVQVNQRSFIMKLNTNFHKR